jgi:hypothetical protein
VATIPSSQALFSFIMFQFYIKKLVIVIVFSGGIASIGDGNDEGAILIFHTYKLFLICKHYLIKINTQ